MRHIFSIGIFYVHKPQTIFYPVSNFGIFVTNLLSWGEYNNMILEDITET